MKLEQFRAGVWRQQYKYKSCQPILVNQQWTWEDATINTLLEQATNALGELNAFSIIVPDIDLFIEMHVMNEAQTSSRIEGTQTGIVPLRSCLDFLPAAGFVATARHPELVEG